jgi:L-glutamine-phosphate cytidylyltransferase
MKVIILAAGRGSRMGEKTSNLPKCMMTLGGKTLIDRCVETLIKSNFELKDIGIVTGYQKDKIQIEGVHYFFNANWDKTNMFISLTMAEEWLRSEACIICYSDIVFSENAIKKLIESKKELVITYYTDFWELWKKRFNNPLDDLETFKLEDNRVIEIGNIPTNETEIQGQYMGLLKFEPSGWLKIEEAVKLSMPKTVEKLDMTTLLQHLINLKYEVNAIRTDELWMECDNENDIELYEEIYKEVLEK